jgi:hypothetical protein
MEVAYYRRRRHLPIVPPAARRNPVSVRPPRHQYTRIAVIVIKRTRRLPVAEF